MTMGPATPKPAPPPPLRDRGHRRRSPRQRRQNSEGMWFHAGASSPGIRPRRGRAFRETAVVSASTDTVRPIRSCLPHRGRSCPNMATTSGPGHPHDGRDRSGRLDGYGASDAGHRPWGIATSTSLGRCSRLIHLSLPRSPVRPCVRPRPAVNWPKSGQHRRDTRPLLGSSGVSIADSWSGACCRSTHPLEIPVPDAVRGTEPDQWGIRDGPRWWRVREIFPAGGRVDPAATVPARAGPSSTGLRAVSRGAPKRR